MSTAVLQKMSDYLLRVPVVKPLVNSITHEVFKHLFNAQDLAFLEGRVVCIDCSTFNLAVCYTRVEGKIRLLPANNWDVKISTSLNAVLLLLADETDADTLFFNRELKLEGDTVLGLLCKNMLDSLDRDRLPSYLSRLLRWVSKATVTPNSAWDR
jgi:O2-independent ubiquinone biosynthesis accessory factor UbiT